MRRLTVGIPAKRARCVAEVRPSRPWGRDFELFFPPHRRPHVPFLRHERAPCHGGIFRFSSEVRPRWIFRVALRGHIRGLEISGTDFGDFLAKKFARFAEIPAVKGFIGTCSSSS